MTGMRNFNITRVPGFKTMMTIILISVMSLTHVQAQNGGVAETTTVTAKVTKIDQKTRKVTIKTDDGKEYSFIAGDNVKNLAQVKKGDIITAVYTEAIAYQVRKHGEPVVKTTEAVVAAEPGSKPAGAAAQQTTVTVTITAIDPT